MPGVEEGSAEIAAAGEKRKVRKLFQPPVVCCRNIRPGFDSTFEGESNRTLGQDLRTIVVAVVVVDKTVAVVVMPAWKTSHAGVVPINSKF